MNQTKSGFPRREFGILLLLAIVQFTNILDFMVMMPLGPQLMRLMAMSPGQISRRLRPYQPNQANQANRADSPDPEAVSQISAAVEQL